MAGIGDMAFVQGMRRCGHIRWFVTNHYKVRTISNSTSYDSFHEQVDPRKNSFLNLSFLEPLDRHNNQAWETEKEVQVQYFNIF